MEVDGSPVGAECVAVPIKDTASEPGQHLYDCGSNGVQVDGLASPSGDAQQPPLEEVMDICDDAPAEAPIEIAPVLPTRQSDIKEIDVTHEHEDGADTASVAPTESSAPAETPVDEKPAKKNKVGVVKLDRETKAIIARYLTVAIAARNLGVTYKQLYGAAHNHNILHDAYWFLVDGDATDDAIADTVREKVPHIKWALRQRGPPVGCQEGGVEAAAPSEGVGKSQTEEAVAEDTLCRVKPCAVGADVDTEILWAPYPPFKRPIRPFESSNYNYIEGSKYHSLDEVRMVEQIDPASNQVVRRYSSCKSAARAMQLKYDKLYLRCYNRGSKSTTLGNFYWRFYAQPPAGTPVPSEADYVSISELLKTRFLARGTISNAGADDGDDMNGMEGGGGDDDDDDNGVDFERFHADIDALCDVEEPPPDPEFDPQNPADYLSKGKVIEQLHPTTKEVVRRYKGAKEASHAMRVENAKLYMRCFNHSAKSTLLGNFYWRFYVADVSPTTFDETSLRDLLRIRYSEYNNNGQSESFGGVNVSGGTSSRRKRKRSAASPGENLELESDADHSQATSQTPTTSRSSGRMVEQLDLKTRKVVRRYRSVKEAAETMQLPDREKLYLRCYRASGRTNSLFNFFWRFYVPSPDEVPEEEFVPIEDLLYIRYSEEVIVKQNKFYSGNLSLNSTAASDSQRNEEDGNGETGTSDGVGSSTPRTESSKPVADGFSVVDVDHALENATSSAQSNGSTGKKSSNHKSEVANDDAGHGKYPPKLIEQLDATTKKVVRRYDGAKAAAAAMDLPYDKVYLRCYNQKRRNVSTPLGNFYWRWQEDDGAAVSEAEYRPIEKLLEIRYKDPVDHNTSKNSSGNKRKKKGSFEVDESLFAYEDLNNYDMLLEDEFTNMNSPTATLKTREYPRAVEQLDKATGSVVRRYATAKEAAVAMNIPYNKLYLRCYNRGSKSTTLGNFIWRFHSPDENGPDTVHEQDFVPIEDLLAVRNSSGGAAGAARGEEEDGEDCSDDDENFDARYEAAIEAAANSLPEDGGLKIKS